MNAMSLTRRLTSVFVAVILAAGVHADINSRVLKVGGPNSQYGSIAAAINAAVDGDVIVTQKLGSFIIDGKSLTIIGEGNPTGPAEIEVRNLALGQVVVISGLSIQPLSECPFPLGVIQIAIRDNEGQVFIEDTMAAGKLVCELFSGSGTPSPTVTVEASNVTFSGCTFYGGTAAAAAAPFLNVNSSTALDIRRGSSVHVYGSTLEGGGGTFPTITAVEAIQATDSFLFVSDSTILESSEYINAGPFSGTYTAMDILSTGNSPGPLWIKDSGDLDYYAASSNVIEFTEPTRRMEFNNSPVPVGTPAQMVFEGEPGDWVFLVATSATQSLRLAEYCGIQFTAPPNGVFEIGRIRGSGQLSIDVLIRQLPPGFELHSFFFQGFFVTPTFDGVLSNPVYGLWTD